MTIISLNGIIGWDVTVEDIKSQLDKATGDITVEVSSGGGLVYPGIAIFNLFRNYSKGQVIMKIIGLAASMASYIPLAGDKIIAYDNAVFMIHNALNGIVGNYLDMRKNADYLESISNLLAKTYQKKTKKPIDEVKKMMDEETFFFGEEMRESGFIDEIIESEKETENENKEDKDVLINSAKAEIDNCRMTIRELDMSKDDIEKAAACIDFIPAQNKKDFSPENSGKINKTKKDDEMSKTLNEILAENTGAKAEYDKNIQAAEKKGKDAINARIESAKNFLGNEKYPKSVAEIAVKVITGETSSEVLTATVAAVDAVNEQKNSDAAKKETEKHGETPASGEENVNDSGICDDEKAFQAEIARVKAEKEGVN